MEPGFVILPIMDSRAYTIVDVETTGGSPKYNRVIDLGVLRVEHGEIIDTFETLLNPGIEIPEYIIKMTGISNGDVHDAPVFDDIKDRLLELCDGSIFVAHNVGFDYGFIRQEFDRVGYGFTTEKLCTVRLSRVLYPEHKRHNLSEIITRFDFECKRRHRAFDDAKVLWDFLQIIREKFPEEDIERAVQRTIKELSPSVQRKLGAADPIELVYNPSVQE